MGKRFPWYDCNWLSKYVSAKEIISRHYPERLAEFTGAFDVLRTPEDFQVKQIRKPLEGALFQEVLDTIRTLPPGSLNRSELFFMGREIVHNLPLLVEIQASLAGMVSAAVNEAVEPCYNFLSLYKNVGILSPHLDAPSAKWTLDLCLAQSSPWPVYFSQVTPWPEVSPYSVDDWRKEIKNDPGLRFTPYALEPGDAVIFSGSSQWHYRDAIPQVQKENFCHLAFFHYIPEGTSHLVHPAHWPDFFNMPELSAMLGNGKNAADK